MKNSYNEEMLRMQAMLDFIWDYKENPEKYGLLTPDVLWNLMEWNLDEEDQDKGVITQDIGKLADFDLMSDEEKYDYSDRVGMMYSWWIEEELDLPNMVKPYEEPEWIIMGSVSEDKD